MSIVESSAGYKRHAAEVDVVEKLILTATGAVVGGYMLGAAYMHLRNKGLRGDVMLLHNNIALILSDALPIGAPSVFIPPQLSACYAACRHILMHYGVV